MKYAPQRRYDAQNTVHLSIKLNTKTDADILARLDLEPNRQGFIKQAIRDYIREENPMKTNSYNYYSYQELLAAATAPDAEQIDIDTLGAWFEQYGSQFWNGESYDADGKRLFPITVWDEESDQGESIHYEFR